MTKQLKKVKLGVIYYAALKNKRANLLCTEIAESHRNNRICQHCGVKTSTVNFFYYVFNISLSCNSTEHTRFHRERNDDDSLQARFIEGIDRLVLIK